MRRQRPTRPPSSLNPPSGKLEVVSIPAEPGRGLFIPLAQLYFERVFD
jgi:hypothetical protein